MNNETALKALEYWRETLVENEQLRDALRAVITDILDYERVNHLAPNPCRKFCWDSVARATALLDKPPMSGNAKCAIDA